MKTHFTKYNIPQHINLLFFIAMSTLKNVHLGGGGGGGVNKLTRLFSRNKKVT